MSCERFEELSDLYLVGEVREQEREQIDAHLAERSGQAVTAPAALRDRIESSLEVPAPVSWNWRRYLVAAALMLAIGLGITYRQAIRPVWTPSRDMVQTHTHYLEQKEAPYEVVTPDRQALASWIADRLGQPITLADNGWNLLGARMSSVNQHPAGLVFYEDRGIRISHFIIPAETLDLRGMKRVVIRRQTCWYRFHQGYRVLIWKQGPVYCGSVSDANTSDVVWR